LRGKICYRQDHSLDIRKSMIVRQFSTYRGRQRN